MSVNGYNDYYNLAMYLNTTGLDNSYMSFTDGVLLNGAIGSGIELARYGGGKLYNTFSKNKPSKFTQLSKQIELQQLKGKSAFETYKNASRYNTILEMEKSIPRAVAGKADYFKEAQKALAEASKLKGAAQAAKFQEAAKLFDAANLKAAKDVYYKEARKLLAEANNLTGSARRAKLAELKKVYDAAKIKVNSTQYYADVKKLFDEAKGLSGSALSKKIKQADKLLNKNLLPELKANYYNQARQALSEAKGLKGAAQVKKLKEAEQLIAQAKLDAYKAKYNGNLKPKSVLGKVKNTAKTVTGVRAANTAVKSLNAGSKVFRVAGKFVKGNAAFAALSVAADYDKFAAAKQAGGTKAMTKEIAKSTGVAAVEAVGFMAGMKAGAAIGTAVGSVVPGVGNIVGGIAGAVIGGLASWGLGKLAHKALGCDVSEADKIGTKKAKLRALRAKYSRSTRENLVKESALTLAQDMQAAQQLEQQGQKDPKMSNPVMKERMEKAAVSLQNIAEDDPELMQDIATDLGMNGTDTSSQQPGTASDSQNPDNQTASQEQTAQQPSETPLQATMRKFKERINGGAQTSMVPDYSMMMQNPWALGGMY